MQKLRARAFRWAVLSDTAAIVIAFAISFIIRYLQPEGTRAIFPYAVFITVLSAGIWVASLALSGAYQWSTVANGITDTKLVVTSTATAFATVATISYVTKSEYPRFFVIVAFPLGALLLVWGRWLVRRATLRQYERGEVRHCALVVGPAQQTPLLAEMLKHAYEVPVNATVELAVDPGSVQGYALIDQVLELVVRHDCQTVVLDQGMLTSNEFVGDISWELDQLHIELLVVPASLGKWASRLLIARHPSLPLLQLSEPRLRPGQRVQKRLLDVAVTVPALLIALPIMLVIGIMVRLTSRGPVLFQQDRVGVDRQLFRFYKFRTMYDGAHLQRQEVLGEPDDGMTERYRNDPRVTPFGHFLRKYSLDELPQLWNVLVGQMSLVGPRPMLIEELPQLAALHHRRHLAKPGLTGLWQINGRKETSWEERMLLDLSYINNWSLSLDLAILAKTVRVVLSGRGGY